MNNLDAIRARRDAATLGPWSLTYSGIDAPSDTVLYIHEYPDGSASIETNVHDAEFINHAYADITSLLTLVDEQAATIARLRDALRWYADALRYGEDEDRRPVNMDESSAIENDCGARARAALVGAPDGEIGA